ncbi:MAG: alanine--tRNA ligase [Myxococcota bacterium]
MTSSRDIRESFLRFFESRGNRRVASGPLVPANDPTLMFANAGMVPFKDVFTGKEKRGYATATSAQKCIRISGKHNDLENVGRTARHHTFFEMLGNFSFGDYFKREAIEHAWAFFKDELKLDPERMVFTVFGGEEGFGPRDDETARLWKEITGCPDERIIACGAKDNFWQMGDTGPCGPCTEIHYCLGMDEVDPRRFGEEPTAEGRGWFELWNLVFMQFDRQADGSMPALPAPSVDTGAGLERIAVVKQGVLSNYDTDLLRPLAELAGEIAGSPYAATTSERDVSMRVIADHARLSAFAISEGIAPGNAKRPYVLRRVMRRAIRHGYKLGIGEPFLHRVTLKVGELMGDAYPQLREQAALVEDVTRREEEQFRRTLEGGLKLIDANASWEMRGDTRVLPGAVAFDLYSTFGFPKDLQEVIGEEKGFVVDDEGFAREMAKAKELSQSSKLNDAKASEKIWFDVRETAGATTFLGYEQERATSEVLALVKDGERVDAVSAGEQVAVVTRQTPFYGEKGGQAGDAGRLFHQQAELRVADTLLPVDGLTVHVGEVVRGTLKVRQQVELEVDHERRQATRRNHSATHVLHWALRQVLGSGVAQKGSLVSADRLRFDYATGRAPTDEELQRIEDLVNESILENTPVTTEVMAMDAAKERGAIGIFEEKYGDVVRVLQIGPSLELCGGTHAFRTGDIGLFTVLSDGNLAAGVRRIEAATGLNALAHLREQRGLLRDAATQLKARPDEAPARVRKLLEGQRALQKEIERLQKELVSGAGGTDLAADAREIDGVRVLGATVPSVDGKALREMADQLRDKLAPAIVLLGAASQDGKKAQLVCSVSKEVTKRFRAGDIVKVAAEIVDGRGGGRPDFAQAGGSDPSKLGDAVQRVYALVEDT